MEIREFRAGDVLVLAPGGSIAGMEELAAIEMKLVTSLKSGFRLLVLDCSAVGHLTSGAIRVLLLTSRKLERTKGRLVLCGMSGKLRQAFSISGFDNDFTIVSTREQAVQRALEPLPQPLTPAPAHADATPLAVTMPSSVAAEPAVMADATSVAAVGPTQPRQPATDARDTIADALLNALGVTAATRPAASSGRTTRMDPDALASALLSVLSVG